jgi:hypothetical protein
MGPSRFLDSAANLPMAVKSGRLDMTPADDAEEWSQDHLFCSELALCDTEEWSKDHSGAGSSTIPLRIGQASPANDLGGRGC